MIVRRRLDDLVRDDDALDLVPDADCRRPSSPGWPCHSGLLAPWPRRLVLRPAHHHFCLAHLVAVGLIVTFLLSTSRVSAEDREPFDPVTVTAQVGGGLGGAMVSLVAAGGFVGLAALTHREWLGYLGVGALLTMPVASGFGVHMAGDATGADGSRLGTAVGGFVGFSSWTLVWFASAAAYPEQSDVLVWLLGAVPAIIAGQIVGYHLGSYESPPDETGINQQPLMFHFSF